MSAEAILLDASVRTSIGGQSVSDSLIGSPVRFQLEASVFNAFGTSDAQVAVAPGTIGVRTSMEVKVLPPGILLPTESFGAVTIDDLVFSSSQNEMIPVRMWLLLEGHLQLAATQSRFTSSTQVDGGFTIKRAFGSTFTQQAGGIKVSSENQGTLRALGLFSDLSFEGTFNPAADLTFDSLVLSTTFLVPTNESLQLTMHFSSNAARPADIGTAAADFLTTFGFPRGSPVFVVPNGVTVNAPSAFLFDNTFLPPNAVVEVPEANTSLLVLCSIGSIIARRKRPA